MAEYMTMIFCTYSTEMKLNWCLHDKNCEVCCHASKHQMVKQWPIALKLTLGTEEHYQWKAWQNLPAHLQALFKRQLLPATTNGRQMSQTHVPLRFRPKNQWVSVLPWWLGVGHKHECFYFLSGPLPTSHTSHFTDASRWSKELR